MFRRLSHAAARAGLNFRQRGALAGASAVAAVAAFPTQERPRAAPKPSDPLAAAESPSSTKARRITDDYVISEELGSGSFARVFRGRSRSTGKAVAIKVVAKGKQSAADTRTELEVLQRVSLHKCIASLEDFYESEDCFHIVMELVDGGDLFDKVVGDGPYSEREAAVLMQELGGAIALLHAQRLCHADLKPENLMLTEDGRVKLVDFGLSFQLGAGSGPRKVGTPSYMPPEMFLDADGAPTPAGDMWSLGVTLYVMLTGRHPFDDASEAQTRRNVIRGDVDFSAWPGSPESQRVVASLLRSDPAQRPTIEQFLQHPWLGAAAPVTGRPADPEVRAREEELARFRLNSARLRAAVFAVMLRQLAESRERTDAKATARARLRAANSEHAQQLRKHGSTRAAMLDNDLLASAFRDFDREGKGFITAADLHRVLASFGVEVESPDELHHILEAAAGYDREARRVTYGNFVRTMSHTVKLTLDKGDVLFRQGDAARSFYLLLSGEVELSHAPPDGSEERVVATIEASDFFGQNALLKDLSSPAGAAAAVRERSARCTRPSEVLKLARADFEVGILGRSAEASQAGPGRLAPEAAQEAARRSARESLLRFIQMVTGSHEASHLRRGEALFRAGDPVEAIYIVSAGKLEVGRDEVEAAAGRGILGWLRRRFRKPAALGEVRPGECCGEMAVMDRRAAHSKSVTCAAERCMVVAVRSADVLRLVDKSQALRESFEQLYRRRADENTGTDVARKQKG